MCNAPAARTTITDGRTFDYLLVPRVFLFLLPEDLQVAGKAQAVVAADRAAAPGAAPFPPLPGQKGPHAPFAYPLEISQRACPVAGAVAAVHAFQMAAGEAGAFMAEPDAPLAYPGAPFLEVGAHLVARDAAGALGDLDALFPRPVNVRKEAGADGAVYAAGGDEALAHPAFHGWGISERSCQCCGEKENLRNVAYHEKVYNLSTRHSASVSNGCKVASSIKVSEAIF